MPEGVRLMAIQCEIGSGVARATIGDAASVQVYVQLSEAPYAYGEILGARRVVDYAADGTPIGVEFLGVSGCVGLSDIPHADQIAAALSRHNIPICA